MVRTVAVEVPQRISGWTFFASIMMLVYAGLLLIAGLAGIFNGDSYFRSGQELMVFNFVSWGWIHVALGVTFLVTGIGLIRDKDWALTSAVLLVMLDILLHLLIIATYPGWAIIFLIFDALLLYSLMVSGGKR